MQFPIAFYRCRRRKAQTYAERCGGGGTRGVGRIPPKGDRKAAGKQIERGRGHGGLYMPRREQIKGAGTCTQLAARVQPVPAAQGLKHPAKPGGWPTDCHAPERADGTSTPQRSCGCTGGERGREGGPNECHQQDAQGAREGGARQRAARATAGQVHGWMAGHSHSILARRQDATTGPCKASLAHLPPQPPPPHTRRLLLQVEMSSPTHPAPHIYTGSRNLQPKPQLTAGC